MDQTNKPKKAMKLSKVATVFVPEASTLQNIQPIPQQQPLQQQTIVFQQPLQQQYFQVYQQDQSLHPYQLQQQQHQVFQQPQYHQQQTPYQVPQHQMYPQIQANPQTQIQQPMIPSIQEEPAKEPKKPLKLRKNNQVFDGNTTVNTQSSNVENPKPVEENTTLLHEPVPVVQVAAVEGKISPIKEKEVAAVVVVVEEEEKQNQSEPTKKIAVPIVVEETPIPIVKVQQEQKPLQEEEEQKQQQHQQQQDTVRVTPDLISYFLEKEQEFEIEDDSWLGLNSSIIRFFTRQYEISAGKEGFNRSSTKNYTSYTSNGGRQNGYNSNNNNSNVKEKNSFPTSNGDFSRSDNRKQTTPANLTKSHSSVKPGYNNNTNEGGIKRQEEDKDVTELKMSIKGNQGKFLVQMQNNKQDQFKKQISDIRLNLNILTPTNIEKIKKILFDISTTEQPSTENATEHSQQHILCEYLVEGIIEKARTQKTYSQMYADLCKYIINESKTKFASTVITPEGKEIVDPQQKIFKNHLYNNIQQTFEGEQDVFNNKMTFAKSKTLAELTSENDKMIYLMDKKKREMLNVQFIGNLYLNKAMNNAILQICCRMLMQKFFRGLCSISEDMRDSNEQEESHYEIHLEALIALFEQTGPTMESKNKKPIDNSLVINQFIQNLESNKDLKDNKEEREKVLTACEQLEFNDYFFLLEWLRKEKKVTPRIHSLITNLLERRGNGWKDRLSTETGPLSVQQFQKQHEQEQIKQQQELAQYEYDSKSGTKNNNNNNNNKNFSKGGRGYNSSKSNVQYEEKNGKSQKSNNGQGNNTKFVAKGDSKLPSDVVEKRVQETWANLKNQQKAGELFTVEHAIADLKKLSDETTAAIFIDNLLKTIYDCNVSQKNDRLAVAYQATEFVKPIEFQEAFNNRLSQSKDESSDFPMFQQFLSLVFYHSFKQGFVKYSALKIQYNPDYDEDQRFDVMFVYKQFFEETIDIIKSDKESTISIADFVDTQVAPVLEKEDENYARWSASMKR